MEVSTIRPNETIIEPRFSEIDALGIVHHSRYIPWVEEANFNFVKNVIQLSRKDLINMEMSNPIKKIEIDYKNHISWDDKVLVKCHMEYSQFAFFNMKNTLISLGDEEKKFAEVKVKVLITDKKLKLKLMAPDFFANKVEIAASTFPEYFTKIEKTAQNYRNVHNVTLQ